MVIDRIPGPPGDTFTLVPALCVVSVLSYVPVDLQGRELSGLFDTLLGKVRRTLG